MKHLNDNITLVKTKVAYYKAAFVKFIAIMCIKQTMLSLTLLVLSLPLKAQSIQQYYDLDTIIHFSHKQIPVQNIRMSTQVISSDTKIYIAFDAKEELKDTQLIYVISLENNIVQKLNYFIPNTLHHKWIKNLNAFTQIGDSLFALSFHQTMLIYRLAPNTKTLEFVAHIEVTSVPTYIKFTRNFLFVGHIYKREKNSPASNTYILKYDVKNNFTLIKKFSFDFGHVEFAYFYPNHWIEINEQAIFIANTCTYKVNVYDHDFKKLSHFEKKPDGWVTMDEKIIHKLSKEIPINEPVTMIDSLAGYNDKIINRVTDFQQINDSNYFICWFDYDSTIKRKIRYLDLFTFDGITLKNTVSNIADKFIERKDSVTALKNDYPIMFWNANSFVGNNRILIFRDFAPIEYVNRPWNIITKELNKYYAKNNPMASVFIYSFNPFK